MGSGSGFGPQASPAIPSGAIVLKPGDDINAAASSNPAGSVFYLRAGIYRLQKIAPRANQVFIGELGAIVSGAKLLTQFTQENVLGRVLFVATGQTQASRPYPSVAECEIAHPADGIPRPRCFYNEEVFVDDQRLIHVDSLGALGPGKWHFDYAADKIYLYEDPAGHRVETSVLAAAFSSQAPGVQIKNLVIEKYANLAQTGAIGEQFMGTGWVIENNEARLNHGVGITLTDQSVARGNFVHHNGQLGIGGSVGAFVVENNEISFNNQAGFMFGWEGGGTKFALTNGFIGRGNYVHDNWGPGLWTDVDNINSLWEGNIVEDNLSVGIVHEISYKAVIKNNWVRRNGLKDWRNSGWLWGAGISIDASSDVEVYGNFLEGNAHGIAGIQQNRDCGAPCGPPGQYGPHLLSGLNVHDNHITVTSSAHRTGIVQDTGDLAVYSSRNNRFVNNIYQYTVTVTHPFAWQNGIRTYAEWRAYGME